MDRPFLIIFAQTHSELLRFNINLNQLVSLELGVHKFVLQLPTDQSLLRQDFLSGTGSICKVIPQSTIQLDLSFIDVVLPSVERYRLISFFGGVHLVFEVFEVDFADFPKLNVPD